MFIIESHVIDSAEACQASVFIVTTMTNSGCWTIDTLIDGGTT